MNKKKTTRMNILYGMLQGGYWMHYCTALSYVSVVMLSKGYSNAEIGIILAIGNAISIFVQAGIAKFADKSKKVALTSILMTAYTLAAVLFGVVIFEKQESILLTVAIVLLAIVASATQGLCNALCYRLENKEVKMNFGASRALGSALFAIVSLVIGNLAEKYNPNIISVFGFFICIYLVVVLLVIALNADTRSKAADVIEEKKENIFLFIKRYKLYFVLLIGVFLFYMSHSFINNFFFQVLENVGGTSADMGGVLCFAAVTELLPMVFYNKLEKKFGNITLFFVSGVFFLVKGFLTFIAWNVAMVYVATFFQMLSFAVFTPAAVTFVNKLMDEKEAVTGQAMLMISVSLAFLVASMTGGILIDGPGVKAMLLVGVITGVIGVCIAGFALRMFAKKAKTK
ncbi:MAG: MFS transporter [Lachnospiraceae bacterium]|nr:MFS transporter [Lachnospiraceae bacterium]